MADSTLVTIWMIKSMDMGFLNGQMAENIKEIGNLVNSMEVGFMLALIRKKNKENGKMEIELNG